MWNVDNLLKVEVVLASGEQVVASEKENPDLFWAIRGAGQVGLSQLKREDETMS